MSLSYLERACPPSRRRSCLACTKAKRRCDNTLPACVRCRRRGVECLYPVRRSGDDKTGQGQNKSTGTGDYTFLPVQACDLVLDGVSTATTASAPASTPFDFSVDCLDATQSFASFTTPVDTPSTLIPTVPLHLSAPLAAANWNFVARIVKSHLGQAMDIIRDAPRRFVHENRLPWSHPLLYRDSMPRSMEDALSSCALSLSKNAVNSPLILRTIDRRMHDLLDAPEPTTPLECVAKTQALLLYNIIGIFDSDINARATVENSQSLLQHAARRLLSFITFDSQADGQALSLGETSWGTWILMESARRTFLVSLYFMHLYCIVVGSPSRTCNERRFLNRYWTISASLWSASSPDEFSRAWAENRFFLARVGNFDELLAEARAEDIDDFSRIFLSSLMGIEEFRMWMAERETSSKAM